LAYDERLAERIRELIGDEPSRSSPSRTPRPS
jgi:hypothetical protein